jgi:hypothetical protein
VIGRLQAWELFGEQIHLRGVEIATKKNVPEMFQLQVANRSTR